MPGLPAVAYGMMGLTFGLFTWGLANVGIDAKSETLMKELAIVGSLPAAMTLLFQASWTVIGAPLGTTGAAAAVQLLFTITPLMYALLWWIFVFAPWYGLDLKLAGDMSFIIGIYQLIFMVIYAYDVGWVLTAGDIVMEITLFTYALVVFLIWGLTHGKNGPKILGAVQIWSGIMTVWLMLFPGGVLPMWP